MPDDMGTFRLNIEIENPAAPGARRQVSNVLIDTGAELSCFPAHLLDELRVVRRKLVRFRQADGSTFARWTGPAFVYAARTSTVDEVIFGEPSDLTLMGARTLEGLNLRIDPVAKALVDAGPMPLAAAS